MFGTHFYHQRIRKAVAVFGSLFNNITILRTDASGATLSQQKVPLSYAPKRDFIARLDAMGQGEDFERQVSLKLPRISFEILAMNYDSIRQLPKLNNHIKITNAESKSASRIYTPIPYTITFQLNAYAKTQDDALQIVEQILPYFTPHYTVTVKPLSEFDIKEDTPITMTGITFSDDYEAPLESRRSIIYTLDFDMKINLYKDISTGGSIIEESCVNFLNLSALPEEELFSKVCADSAFSIEPLVLRINEDQDVSGFPFKIKNLPSEATSVSSTVPDQGSASVALGPTLISENGVITATGTYNYTSLTDYSGLDSFNIIHGGDWGNRTIPVSVELTSLDDIVDDSIVCAVDSFVDFNVYSNDTWESPIEELTFSVAIGGDPANGTVTVLDPNLGIFRYTPNPAFTGADEFIYRGTPSGGGTSEAGTVTITVS